MADKNFSSLQFPHFPWHHNTWYRSWLRAPWISCCIALIAPPPCQPHTHPPISGPWKERGPSPLPGSDRGHIPLSESAAHLWNLEGLFGAESGPSKVLPWCPAQSGDPVGARSLPSAWQQGGRPVGQRERAGSVERAKKAIVLLLLPPPSAGFHLWRENNSKETLVYCSFSLASSPHWPFLAWAPGPPPTSHSHFSRLLQSPTPCSCLQRLIFHLFFYILRLPPCLALPPSLQAGRVPFPLPSVLVSSLLDWGRLGDKLGSVEVLYSGVEPWIDVSPKNAILLSGQILWHAVISVG